jgi:hypothetical protein
MADFFRWGKGRKLTLKLCGLFPSRLPVWFPFPPFGMRATLLWWVYCPLIAAHDRLLEWLYPGEILITFPAADEFPGDPGLRSVP